MMKSRNSIALALALTGLTVPGFVCAGDGASVIGVTYSDQKRAGAFGFGGLEVNANLSVEPGYSRRTAFRASSKTR
jgi:hypothetical protein